MGISHRPYLIIPKLIEQPTWGGDYITHLKKWTSQPFLHQKRIGQSYELFGQSKLSLTLHDSRDERFIPELGSADKPDMRAEYFPLQEKVDYITLSDLVKTEPRAILGQHVIEQGGSMPLLIKITQSLGNSFQLHVKTRSEDKYWQPKPESWYYLEDGLVTCGVKRGINVDEYRRVCETIDALMHTLSHKVRNNEMPIDEARQQAKKTIAELDPWQFVNKHKVKKHELIDLSAGGLHHSWEEDQEHFPLGNIVYEVQLDVMDPIATIRSFDQGKFKADGTIRNVHIDDYFRHLDTDPYRNDIANLKQKRQGNRLLTTPYYALDIIEVTEKVNDRTQDSFVHLYVQEGEAEVAAEGGTLYLTQGHSCFLPHAVGDYQLTAKIASATILKTFIEV